MRDPFDGPPSGVILTPIEITCNRIVRRSSKYRNLKRAAKRQALRLWISRKNRLGGGHEDTGGKSGGVVLGEHQRAAGSCDAPVGIKRGMCTGWSRTAEPSHDAA